MKISYFFCFVLVWDIELSGYSVHAHMYTQMHPHIPTDHLRKYAHTFFFNSSDIKAYKSRENSI